MGAYRVLIVDDEPNMRRVLSDVLAEEGYEVAVAKNGNEGAEKGVSGRFDVVVLDLKLPDCSGIDVLKKIRKGNPETAVIMMTAFSSVETAIEAMKLGAYDYITKPFKIDKFKGVIKSAIKATAWTRVKPGPAIFHRFPETEDELGIIGETPAMKKVLDIVSSVAQTNATVLIYGESGTGKELIARAIHLKSPRASRPLIKVSCAALPESLLESELFGHEKGAFTNAISTRPGRFELADTGTLFLDEVGEMSPNMQVKLLRVLQEREFERVGGSRSIKVDVRIIAATNKNLQEAVRAGAFREDLYYRLSVVPIYLPPLRERREDIPLLAMAFMRRFSRETGNDVTGISDEAMAALMEYDWPGNVRELENCIERAVIFSKGKVIGPEILFLNTPAVNGPGPSTLSSGSSICAVEDQAKRRAETASPGSGTEPEVTRKSLEDVEREHIIRVLKQTNRNRTEAAKILKITRRTLLNKIKEYGIIE
ncbi:MAG TPA: sigma-54-dependent Fis family transcriptional regulator [Firmicutes bacterium]|nr:sigma-54-dependent Fis family transcriptional regulator [Bacillota bacterium]